MNSQEGVIKFQLKHNHSALDGRVRLTELNAWRSILYRLRLIGKSPHKYDGLSYGNISTRLAPGDPRFVISGTQTGHKAVADANDYCQVNQADPYQNRVVSQGPCKPSSEALTHSIVYRLRQSIQCVIHVHCSEIWQQTDALSLPFTAANIAYGTVEMAIAVEQLFRSNQLHTLSVFSMLGHEDGVIAFGESIPQAADRLIHCLVNAIGIDQESI